MRPKGIPSTAKHPTMRPTTLPLPPHLATTTTTPNSVPCRRVCSDHLVDGRWVGSQPKGMLGLPVEGAVS
ncbi:hypothetical protein TIFTF001_039876 [Ficus carica]|uniref:Uncharacterized protein n=1 Tax=Ficus carica TaxID=3494 RepID=A0AA88CVD5_FICCA|nr:hypothetical protein TIFTF001_039876 [Ficus carica]